MGGMCTSGDASYFLVVEKKNKGEVLSWNEVGAKEKDLYGVCNATLISRDAECCKHGKGILILI